MQQEKAAPRGGPPTSRLPQAAPRPEVDGVPAAWRRVAARVQRLVAAASSGTAGRKAEATLSGDAGRIRGDGRERARVDARDTLEVSLSVPLDGRGPRAARAALEGLHGRVAPSVIADAQIVVSELVGNAVRHGGVSNGGVVRLWVTLTSTTVRLEVADPGCGGVIAPRAPDLEGGGGFGLQIVRAVSEQWGLEQDAAGGTRVWAQLARVPTAAPATAQDGDAAGEVSRNGHSSNGRATAERRTPRTP
jgi:anti-sigma regulatory factor (Ser/Thr protein kinase)